MNKDEAEAKIQHLCKTITLTREAPHLTAEQKSAEVAKISGEIRKLKEITGARHIKGVSRIGR